MTEYKALTRTNYFRVIDAAAFADCLKNCRTYNNHPVVPMQYMDHGVPYYGFYCEDHLLGLIPNGYIDPHIILFWETLQQLVAKDDAIIISEIGHEGTNYLDSSVVVIAKSAIEIHNLNDIGRNTAKKLLNNPNWETQSEENSVEKSALLPSDEDKIILSKENLAKLILQGEIPFCTEFESDCIHGWEGKTETSCLEHALSWIEDQIQSGLLQTNQIDSSFQTGYAKAVDEINHPCLVIQREWHPSECPRCGEDFSEFEPCDDGYYQRCVSMTRCPYCGQKLKWENK